ncbi:hypothetical protein [Methanosarcina siciliae]|uniref:hypothetical protein n=1 Tax=Methanosarcina siciliae TaxID=38027 RepID=UPI001E593409|nr:hypothetical protein [Methanosarcina siciliae]
MVDLNCLNAKALEEKTLPKLIPFGNLKYAKVCKKKVRGYVVKTIGCIFFGKPGEILKIPSKHSTTL